VMHTIRLGGCQRCMLCKDGFSHRTFIFYNAVVCTLFVAFAFGVVILRGCGVWKRAIC
jgi:uncharacterized membrane protein